MVFICSRKPDASNELLPQTPTFSLYQLQEADDSEDSCMVMFQVEDSSSSVICEITLSIKNEKNNLHKGLPTTSAYSLHHIFHMEIFQKRPTNLILYKKKSCVSKLFVTAKANAISCFMRCTNYFTFSILLFNEIFLGIFLVFRHKTQAVVFIAITFFKGIFSFKFFINFYYKP